MRTLSRPSLGNRNRRGAGGSMTDRAKLCVLVVERNPYDINIIKRAMRSSEAGWEAQYALDGEEALDALAQKGQSGTMPSPALILIDINLPKINGLEVLSRIKEDDRLRRIPIVILAVSEREEDMVKAYELGAATYMMKPVDAEQLTQLLETVKDYWKIAGRSAEQTRAADTTDL